jgi:hypothetical protein
VWCEVKAGYIRHNVSAGNDTLSLSVYEPIATQILLGGREDSPKFRGGVELGVWMWHRYPVKVRHNRHYSLFVGWNRCSVSFRLQANHHAHLALCNRPKFGEGVEIGGRLWYTIKPSIIGIICLLELTLYVSPFTSQSLYYFAWRTIPQVWGRSGL